MRTTLRVLAAVVFVVTIAVLVPYVGLGPPGEPAPGEAVWSAFFLEGLLIVEVGFGSALLQLWGAARLRGDGQRGR